MNRPSRGERPSAATTRYVGCLVLPMRMSRSFTAIRSQSLSSVETGVHLGLHRLERLEVGELAARTLAALLALLPAPAEARDALHHLRHLFELLAQLVDLGHRGAAAVGDPEP